MLVFCSAARLVGGILGVAMMTNPMLRGCLWIGLLVLSGLGAISHATDLKVVVLDSKEGKPMHSKLVCIAFPNTDPIVTNQRRMCGRTDSTGTAAFRLPEPVPDTVKVELGTNNLMPCYAQQAFEVADALKDGLVAKNTCADGTTETRETGEVVVYAHQKSVKEVLGTARDEF